MYRSDEEEEKPKETQTTLGGWEVTTNKKKKKKKKATAQEDQKDEEKPVTTAAASTAPKRKADKNSNQGQQSKKIKSNDNKDFKNKSKNPFQKKDEGAISDDRLKAYGINPRKFHNQQKFGNKNAQKNGKPNPFTSKGGNTKDNVNKLGNKKFNSKSGNVKQNVKANGGKKGKWD